MYPSCSSSWADTPIPSDLIEAIQQLKVERNAIILAHYYQDSEIQDIADVVGDSLQLAQAAAKTSASTICFAGVHFMAETAKILNPDRTVVLPDLEAGCSLAQSCPAPAFQKWIVQHPGAAVVTYINCSAEVKALSDYIVTSSNAETIIRHLPADRDILFAPDKNLGHYLQKKTGRSMHLWSGSCIVHETFSERKVVGLKVRYPEAAILAHPECEPILLHMADFIGSTTAIINHALASNKKEFIIATEPGILHQLKKKAPEKVFISAPPQNDCACNECPFMRKNTLEKVYLSLRDLKPEIKLSATLIEQAHIPIQRMLELSAS
ncbi:quinolinate synthase NadA [Pajaroellobacter abortibovis]|uniref:Quinolinate synthase n=1 Tax=Pajaroellobacter abortibovis TaxID=1882918 RepID=A0A1L6MVC8_9BACT|nr:quinolinate synthase NadA [Pajaroellobacter abortibovis]APR99462.1 quinolinate synthase [Pajaroellobacter abortibovis]